MTMLYLEHFNYKGYDIYDPGDPEKYWHVYRTGESPLSHDPVLSQCEDLADCYAKIDAIVGNDFKTVGQRQ